MTSRPGPQTGNPQFIPYDYHDASGRLRYQNVRVQQPDGSKCFFQRRPDGNGGWIKGLGSPRQVPRLLFNLLALLDSHPSTVVVVHEGEKAALAAQERLTNFIHVATGGSLAQIKHSVKYLRNRHVVLLPDNDKPGKRGAWSAGDVLTKAGAASVRILHLPALPEKGDCFDWLEAGGSIDQFQKLVNEAPQYATKTSDQAQDDFRERLERAKQTDVLDLVRSDTQLKRISKTEYAGPCPFCPEGGEDRFHVNVEKNGWFCRHCTEEPHPGRPWYSAVDYVMRTQHLKLAEAVDHLLGDRHVASHVNKSAQPAAPLPHHSWTFLSIDEARDLPPPEYLIDNKLLKGGLNLLYGPSGVGKSFFALDLSLKIAQKRNVFYLAGEGHSGYADRIRAWEAHHGVSGGNFHLSQDGLPSLLDSRSIDALIEALLPTNPALVVIDTLAYAITGGDENSQKDMSILVSHLNRLQKATGCAVLVVHHTNKAGRGPRGSTVLPFGADIIMEVSGDEGSFTVTCEKAKEDQPFADEHYQLVPVATRGERSSMVPVRTQRRVVVSSSDALSNNQRRILETLALTTFRKAGCGASVIGEQSKVPAGSLYRTLSQLMEDGFVTQAKKGDPYYISEQGLKRLSELGIIDYHTDDDSDGDGDSGRPNPSIITITTRKGDSDDSDGSPPEVNEGTTVSSRQPALLPGMEHTQMVQFSEYPARRSVDTCKHPPVDTCKQSNLKEDN